MSKTIHQFESGTIGVLHVAGPTLRVLTALAKNGRPRLREARSFPCTVPAETLRAHLDEQKIERAIIVLSSSSVVCRTMTLPSAEPEQLRAALQLQAETHLAGSSPAHRTGMTVLPQAPGETSRCGLVLSWPESSPEPASLAGIDLGRPTTFAPDIAALAALLNGRRPARPLIWLDPAVGSIGLAVAHANGATFRAAREDAGSPEQWKRHVTRVLAETALSVGHRGAFVDDLVAETASALEACASDGPTLLVPPDLLEDLPARFDDAPSEASWWADYGIAAGIALAATGELRALTSMHSAPIEYRQSRVDRALTMLRTPRIATMTVIASLLLLALLPLASAGLRLGILEYRHADISDHTKAIATTERRLSMYSALEREAWSMTKILSDIVCNTPEGIQLSSIRLQHADESFSVSGEAGRDDDRSATELVALMQEQLRATGIFSEIKLNWAEPDNLGLQDFELSAKIVAPHRRVRYDTTLDFAVYPLVDRQIGKPPPTDDVADAGARVVTYDDDVNGSATGDGRPAAGRSPVRRGGTTATGAEAAPRTVVADGGRAEDDRTSDAPARPTRRTGGLGEGPIAGAGSRSDTDDRVAGGGPALGMIPEPLTQAQINAMSESEVFSALKDVSMARGRVTREQDPDLFDRLKSEFEMLIARRREASK